MVAHIADADTGQRRHVNALPVAPGGQRRHMQSHAGEAQPLLVHTGHRRAGICSSSHEAACLYAVYH